MPKNIFHSSAGTKNAGMYNPSNFEKIALSKPIGRVLDSKVGKKMLVVGNAVIKGTKKVVKALDKHFVEPSRNYNKIQKAKDDANREKAEAGEYN